MSRNTEYEFIPTDTSELEAQMIARYEAMTGETVMPASPERLMIQWVASVILAERVNGNYAANQNLPSRAVGENLDALAELYYAQNRPAAKPAACSVRFSISEAQTSAILIPAGTRVTDASQKLYWETVEAAYVAIGNTYCDVPVRCQTSGTVGNGYAAGQINTIVDVYDYYSGCANTTESGGGADAATDDELYDLLKSSMYAYSTAGPRHAYEYLAKSVSTEIADVKAVRTRMTRTEELPLYELSGRKYAFLGGDELDTDTLKVYPHGSTTAATITTDYSVSYANGLLTITVASDGALASETQVDVEIELTGAGRVAIYVLMDDGTIAGTEVKSAVLAACNDESVRPLSDLVTVSDPETVSYNINLTYYIPENSTSSAPDIQAAVEAAVSEYKAWQCARLGRDINPSYLIGLLMQTGIKRVVVTSPTYSALHDGSDQHVPQIAVVGSTTVTNGGVENE
jgi:phage-related baseplate assembly protein